MQVEEGRSPNSCSHNSIPPSAPWRWLRSSPGRAVNREDGKRVTQLLLWSVGSEVLLSAEGSRQFPLQARQTEV